MYHFARETKQIQIMYVNEFSLHTNIFILHPKQVWRIFGSWKTSTMNKSVPTDKYDVLVKEHTSPKAPRPIIVKGSKSSTHSFCLCSLIFSVSFLSRSFIRFWWSSSEIHASFIFRSRIHLLWSNYKHKYRYKHNRSRNIT